MTARLTMRADKWLWHARFFKTRGLATKLISGGHLRVNAEKVAKPAHPVGADDVLTFPQGRRIRVVRIVDLSTRRGPATEAQALYHDLTAPDDAPKPARLGRPSKKARRDAVRRKQAGLE